MPYSPIRRSSTRGNMILTGIFAIPFALIGAVMAGRLVWTVVSAVTMQRWSTVPATIHSVNLDDGKTRKVTAEYSYTIDGKEYTAKKVSLYGPDNIGSFFPDVYHELDNALKLKSTFPAHVNPSDPTEAILFPVIRIEIIAFTSLFVVLFGGAGFGLIIAAILGVRRKNIEDKLIAQYPKEPWRHRHEWATSKIKSSQSSAAVGASVLAVMFNVCSVPLIFIIPEKLKAGEPLVLLTLVFPLCGFGLIYWAVIAVARARRFRQTFLELETYPARQGEELKGRILAPAALGESKEVKLHLECQNYSRSSSGKGDTVRVEWQADTTGEVLRGQAASGQMAIKVSFIIPSKHPDSDCRFGFGAEWVLTASAELSGADFEAEFSIPVYQR